MLATAEKKAVDQVPGCRNDLGSNAEVARLAIRLLSDAHGALACLEVMGGPDRTVGRLLLQAKGYQARRASSAGSAGGILST